MDILMIYWNAAVRDAARRRKRPTTRHSLGELSAFRRSLRRAAPILRPLKAAMTVVPGGLGR